MQHGRDTRHIEPMVYTSRAASRMGTTASEPYLLVQAITAGQPDRGDPSHTLALTFMQTMISCMQAQL
ncbi:MAG: hypothetical protein AUG53_17890 [Delftia sp. 13_1_20CM_4_67_18]|nr:MAG: hypothetical protein AUG53_17890 [Delftia sp. 13_1_20CM_4_67_18]